MEARIAQGRPPSTGYLKQMESLIEQEQRQIDFAPRAILQAAVPRPPPIAKNGAERPHKQAPEISKPASSRAAQQKQLQEDFSRVGENMKKIQEKVRAINK